MWTNNALFSIVTNVQAPSLVMLGQRDGNLSENNLVSTLSKFSMRSCSYAVGGEGGGGGFRSANPNLKIALTPNLRHLVSIWDEICFWQFNFSCQLRALHHRWPRIHYLCGDNNPFCIFHSLQLLGTFIHVCVCYLFICLILSILCYLWKLLYSRRGKLHV